MPSSCLMFPLLSSFSCCCCWSSSLAAFRRIVRRLNSGADLFPLLGDRGRTAVAVSLTPLAPLPVVVVAKGLVAAAVLRNPTSTFIFFLSLSLFFSLSLSLSSCAAMAFLLLLFFSSSPH